MLRAVVSGSSVRGAAATGGSVGGLLRDGFDRFAGAGTGTAAWVASSGRGGAGVAGEESRGASVVVGVVVVESRVPARLGPSRSRHFATASVGGCPAGETRRKYLWTLSNGTLWNLSFNGTQWAWSDHSAPTGVTFVSERPSAISWTELGNRRHSVFLRDTQSNLRERRWNGSTWSWINHGKPGAVSTITAPSAVIWRNPQLTADPDLVTTTSAARNVFVIGSNNKAYMRSTTNGTNWAWRNQTTNFGNASLHQPRGITAMAYFNR